MKNYHKLGSFKTTQTYSLPAPEVRSSNIRVSAKLHSFGGSGTENLFSCLCQLQEATWILSPGAPASVLKARSLASSDLSVFIFISPGLHSKAPPFLYPFVRPLWLYWAHLNHGDGCSSHLNIFNLISIKSLLLRKHIHRFWELEHRSWGVCVGDTLLSTGAYPSSTF